MTKIVGIITASFLIFFSFSGSIVIGSFEEPFGFLLSRSFINLIMSSVKRLGSMEEILNLLIVDLSSIFFKRLNKFPSFDFLPKSPIFTPVITTSEILFFSSI